MPSSFFRSKCFNLSKLPTKHVKLAIFYVKIPNTKHYPKTWTCILWYVLRDWNSRPDYLIVIQNLTLYLSNIKCFKTNCVVLCQQNEFVSNIVLISITPFLNCINM